MEAGAGPPRSAAPAIRTRTAEDLPACLQMLTEVHRSDGYPVNWPAEPARWLARASGLGAWVAEREGRLLGHVGLSTPGQGDVAPELWAKLQGAGAAQPAVVSRLFVAGAARGGGVGALLLRRVAQEARERGCHPVLDVVASDSGAISLYERLGWRWLGSVERRWGTGQLVTLHCYAAGETESGG